MGRGSKSSDIDIVHNFLSKENRPFSVQNIVDALQKEGVKKTAVERALATLVEKTLVNKKEYGKAKIFLLAQDKLSLPDQQEMDQIDQDIKSNTDNLKETNNSILGLRNRVSTLSQQYTLEEANERLSAARKDFAKKTAKLNKLGDPANLMSKEDKFNAEKLYYDTRLLWKKYRRLVKNVVGQVSEATGRKPSEIYEEVGVETDEAAQIDLATFREIPNPTKTKRPFVQPTPSKRQRLSD